MNYVYTRTCNVTLVFITIKLFNIIYVLLFCALVFYLLLHPCEGVKSSGAAMWALGLEPGSCARTDALTYPEDSVQPSSSTFIAGYMQQTLRFPVSCFPPQHRSAETCRDRNGRALAFKELWLKITQDSGDKRKRKLLSCL